MPGNVVGQQKSNALHTSCFPTHRVSFGSNLKVELISVTLHPLLQLIVQALCQRLCGLFCKYTVEKSHTNTIPPGLPNWANTLAGPTFQTRAVSLK